MDPPVCEAPDRHPLKPGFPIPAGATDCHAHIFDSNGPSKLDEHRSYSPSHALQEHYHKMHEILGISRGVIVQPSVYGVDNATTMKAVTRSPEQLRAVVVLDQNVDAKTVLNLHKQGARGARINMLFGSSARLDNLKQLSKTIRSIERGWHLQLLVDVSTFDNVYAWVKSLDIDVVFDHMGHFPLHKGINEPGFQALLRLLDENRCWVKLSGAYRLSEAHDLPYLDVDVAAQALVAQNPERLVWGSDWPHPQFAGNMPNDGGLLDELARWVPDETRRNHILVDNAARLYDF